MISSKPLKPGDEAAAKIKKLLEDLAAATLRGEKQLRLLRAYDLYDYIINM